MMRELIRPIEKIEDLNLPKNRIPVALHVRRGGGFDPPHRIKEQPRKFPPDIYYIEQIKFLFRYLDGLPLHIHILREPQVDEDHHTRV